MYPRRRFFYLRFTIMSAMGICSQKMDPPRFAELVYYRAGRIKHSAKQACSIYLKANAQISQFIEPVILLIQATVTLHVSQYRRITAGGQLSQPLYSSS